ncbi:hypothetical protein BSPLISOX_1886 [uncultured Gammaproteobacteria bacterium]|jgi:hypothetical protein|nr:hypothetical protein BSPLISOX_1886 [uncultured Gammaproteobacteria bacterium]
MELESINQKDDYISMEDFNEDFREKERYLMGDDRIDELSIDDHSPPQDDDNILENIPNKEKVSPEQLELSKKEIQEKIDESSKANEGEATGSSELPKNTTANLNLNADPSSPPKEYKDISKKIDLDSEECILGQMLPITEKSPTKLLIPTVCYLFKVA